MARTAASTLEMDRALEIGAAGVMGMKTESTMVMIGTAGMPIETEITTVGGTVMETERGDATAGVAMMSLGIRSARATWRT
jgi:hypothetical protein